MAATSSPQLLDQVGRILESKGIAWATIGALAVAYHGVVRASLNADALITLRNSGQDLDALVLLLRAQGWKAEARLGDEGDPLGFVVRIFDDSDNQVENIYRNLLLRLCKAFGREEEIICKGLLGA
jgi:hypothetical protein